MAHKVFICHSSKDRQIANAACAALEGQGIPAWIAPRDILAGEEYGEAIVDAIAECQIVVLIFSLDANNSTQVKREVERAVSKGKIIVPFRIENVMPSRAMEYALSNTHWLDALTPPMGPHLALLGATTERLLQKQSAAESNPHEGELPTDGLPNKPEPILDKGNENRRALPKLIAETVEVFPRVAVAPTEIRERPRTWLRRRAVLAIGLVGVLLASGGFAIWRFYLRIEPFASFSTEQLTNSGDVTNIAFSPDGKTLAEVRSAGGQYSVWMRNISTGRDLQILPPVVLDYGSLNFSRDGDILYFARKDGDNFTSFNLYSVPVLGGEPRLIVRNVGRTISMSPDDQQIAFRRQANDATEMHIVTLANGDDSAIKVPGDDLSSPAWSPDGRTLAWISPNGPAMGSKPDLPPRCAVTVFDLSSKKSRDVLLPAGIHSGFPPTWLPSGNQLLLAFSKAYSGVRDPGDQIGLLSIGSGDFRQLTNDMINHLGLAVPADGRMIATLLQQDSSEVGFYNQSGATLMSSSRLPRKMDRLAWHDEDRLLTSDPWIGFLHRDSGNFKDVVLEFPTGAGYAMWGSDSVNTTPAVCPDGNFILTGSVGGVNQLYLVDSNGQFIRTLVKTQAGGMFCNPEDELAYYSEADPKSPSIWTVPLGGGTPSKLMPIPHAAPLVYSADGRLAAYVLDDAGHSTATIINLDERKVVRDLPLTNHVRGTLPHFNHGGSDLIFVEQGAQGFALASQPINGSPPHVLTNWYKDPISDFGWSPSGNTLAIMWDRTTSDVALIRDKSKGPQN